MNIYYLEIIGVNMHDERKIEAEGVSWSESGLYEFWSTDENGRRRAVAYFPVGRTIINKIEYDI
jgi:hypothetical protein